MPDFNPNGTSTPDMGTQFPIVNMYREPVLAQKFRDFIEECSGPLAFTHKSQAIGYFVAVVVDGDNIGIHIPYPINPSAEGV